MEILRLPRAERRIYFEQAAANLGQLAAVVEKDFWVCWTLRQLFSQPEWGSRLMFKGGTSLSKGWRLIKRFSEDIDIVIDRRALGFPGDHSLGNSQLKKLRSACQQMVGQKVEPYLASCAEELGDILRIEQDETDPDGQTILVGYENDFGSTASYLRPAVKVELGRGPMYGLRRPFLSIACSPKRCPTKLPGSRSPFAPWRLGVPSGRRQRYSTKRNSGPRLGIGRGVLLGTTTICGA